MELFDPNKGEHELLHATPNVLSRVSRDQTSIYRHATAHNDYVDFSFHSLELFTVIQHSTMRLP